MGSLTETQLRQIGNFDADTYTALKADLDAGEAIDALSADAALSLTRIISELSVTGTDAYTLAAPTFTNQRKIVRCVLAASTPAATLTVTSPDDTTGFVCPATFFMDVVGQEVEFIATAALKWRVVRIVRAGSGDVTVGTTSAVLTVGVSGTSGDISTATAFGAGMATLCLASTADGLTIAAPTTDVGTSDVTNDPTVWVLYS